MTDTPVYVRAGWLTATLVGLAVAAGCGDPEPVQEPVLADQVYLTAPVGDDIAFAVDSVVYDPVIGGTARLTSSTTWSLRRQESDSLGVTFVVAVADSSGDSRDRYLWRWRVEDERRLVSSLDGLELFHLPIPLRASTLWDPLIYANREREIFVAGEPVEAYKLWDARVDSVGTYRLPDGSDVEAVWVALAHAENLIELREVREVFGAGVGLLERHVRILDTQRIDADADWSERAEAGFEVHIVRTR